MNRKMAISIIFGALCAVAFIFTPPPRPHKQATENGRSTLMQMKAENLQ